MDSIANRNTRKHIRRLHQALAEKNLEEIKSVLTEYFDVDYPFNGQLSSEIALETNDINICEALFKTVPDLNKQLACGNTLLYKAVAYKSNIKIIKLLLENGADPDIGNDSNETPIHKAASLGLTEILRLLVHRSHYLNRCDTSGQSAIFKAVINGHSDIVEIFIEAGADLEWTDSERRTPLICAVECNQLDVVRTLLDARCNVNARDRYGSTPLMFAARNNNLKILKELLEAHADVEKADSKGRTPFSEAVSNIHLDIVSELINMKCDINSINFELRQTALHKCISQASHVYNQRFNQLKLFDLLIKSGASVDIPDQLGCTPLYLACLRGETEIANVLLDRGADINHVILNGDTMLHGAVVGNSIDLVNLLIQKGCAVNPVNKQNECPLFLAINNKSDIEIIKTLIANKCDLNICDKKNHQSSLLLSIMKRFTQASKELILAGCDVNLTNNSCISPLWAACDMNNDEIVEILLQNPSTDINLGYHSAPLHAAVKNKNLKITKMLTDHKCDLNKLNDTCKSALYLAAEHNNLDIAVLLIKCGANPSIHHRIRKPGFCCLQYKDPHPHLELEPLFVAFQNDNLKMISILILATYKLPYNELNTLKDIIFRTSYVRDMKMTEKTVFQYANFFAKILSSPRMLKELCRGVIREELGQYPGEKITKLKLPDQLLKYLTLPGIDSIVITRSMR